MLDLGEKVLTLKRGVDYTTEVDPDNMVGHSPELGDIVAIGIEPGAPYGRIIGIDKTKDGKIGTWVVQTFNGDIRLCSVVSITGYCKRDDWDGPTPNYLWKLPKE